MQGIYFEGNSKKQAVGEWESERVAGGGAGQFKRNLLSNTLQLRVTRALTHWGALG